MADKLDPNDLVSVEALALSGAWEVAALVELLERKGLCTKQVLYDIIKELWQRNPAALEREGLLSTAHPTPHA